MDKDYENRKKKDIQDMKDNAKKYRHKEDGYERKLGSRKTKLDKVRED